MARKAQPREEPLYDKRLKETFGQEDMRNSELYRPLFFFAKLF
jgi:hypothetical protein